MTKSTVPLARLLGAIVVLGASRIVVDAVAAPPPPSASTMSFACFVSIVAADDRDGEDDVDDVADDDRANDRATTTTMRPLVWCDVLGLPPGRDVVAEIRDGSCESFVDVARSERYASGFASPFYFPVLSEDEKAMGDFDHRYCCRVDVLSAAVDGDDAGNDEMTAVSVLSVRHDMDVTYSYRKDGAVDGNDYDKDKEDITDGSTEEEVGAKAVVEVLSSVSLTDANTRSMDVMEDLAIGLGVLAGAVFTIAMVAIIYGGGRIATKKNRMRRRGQLASDARAEADADDEGDANHVDEMAFIPPTRKEDEIV